MMLYAILDDVLKIVFVVALKNNNTIFPQEQFKKRTFGLDFFFLRNRLVIVLSKLIYINIPKCLNNYFTVFDIQIEVDAISLKSLSVLARARLKVVSKIRRC